MSDTDWPTRSSRTLLEQAQAYVEAGDFERAEQEYLQILQSGAHRAEALYGLGVVALLERGDLDVAESYFDEALTLAPRDEKSLYRLGEIAEARGDTLPAGRRFVAVLGIDPRHRGARDHLERLGVVVPPAGDPPQAPRQAVLGPPRAPRYGDSYIGVVQQLQVHKRGTFRSPAITFALTFPFRPGAGALGVRLAGSSGDTLRGAVGNGQWVELHRSAKRKEGRLHVSEMLNLDTGTPVFATMSAAKRRGAARSMHMSPRMLAGARNHRARFSEHKQPSPLLTQHEREQLGASLAAAAAGATAAPPPPPDGTDRPAAAPPGAPRSAPPARTEPRAGGGKRTGPRVALVVGALALAAVGAVAVLMHASRSSSSAARASVQAYWHAIGDGDYDAAFGELDSSEQSQVGGRASFVNAHASDAPINVQVQLGSAAVHGGSAIVPVVALQTVGHTSGCARWTGRYRVRDIGSHWLIDGVDIARHSC